MMQVWGVPTCRQRAPSIFQNRTDGTYAYIYIMLSYAWMPCIMDIVVYMRAVFDFFVELVHFFSLFQLQFQIQIYFPILIPISVSVYIKETIEEGLCDAVAVWRCYDPKPVKNTPLCIQKDVQGQNYYFAFSLLLHLSSLYYYFIFLVYYTTIFSAVIVCVEVYILDKVRGSWRLWID